MRRVLVLLSIIVLISSVSPVMANIIYYEDCEDKPSSTHWRPIINGDASKSFAVSSKYKKAGSKSWKYSIGSGRKNSHNEHRFIGEGLSNFPRGKEFWIGMSVYIPSNYTKPAGWPQWGIALQWHANPDSCETWRNPNMAFYLSSKGDEYDINIKSQSAKCGTKVYDRNEYRKAGFTKGKWHNIVQRLKFGYKDGTAITQIWVDGKQIYNDTKANCFNDDLGFYFVIGPYTQEWGFDMYIDEIRIGDERSSYEEVSPKGVPPVVDELPVEEELNPPTLKIYVGTNKN